MLFVFSTSVLIRHLWQLKAVVFLHLCMTCALLLTWLTVAKPGSTKANGREPKSCLVQVFNFKSGCFCYAYNCIGTHKHIHIWGWKNGHTYWVEGLLENIRLDCKWLIVTHSVFDQHWGTFLMTTTYPFCYSFAVTPSPSLDLLFETFFSIFRLSRRYWPNLLHRAWQPQEQGQRGNLHPALRTLRT